METRDGHGVSLSRTPGDRTAFGRSDLSALRAVGTTGGPPASATAVSFRGRTKSYRYQVWETVLLTLGLVALWMIIGWYRGKL